MRSSWIILFGVTGAVVVAAVAIVLFLPFSPSTEAVIISNPPGAGSDQSLSFVPQNILVVVGLNNTVTWINNDDAPHTSHSNVPEFDSGIYGVGESFTHTFTRTGTFPYHCDLHPWMTGTITVRGS